MSAGTHGCKTAHGHRPSRTRNTIARRRSRRPARPPAGTFPRRRLRAARFDRARAGSRGGSPRSGRRAGDHRYGVPRPDAGAHAAPPCRARHGGRTLPAVLRRSFYHVCQAEHPAWGAEDNPLLLATRLRVLAEAAARGSLLFFGHMPYPLRITADADGYTAHPVREANLLKGDDDAE